MTKRILLVDDSREELEGLVQMLADKEGEWRIESAESGALALQRLQLHPFDVVVTDYHMPKMTGEDLLRKVMLEYPQTVRIILSGYFDEKATARMVQTAHQYLSKPCQAIELKEAIARALFLRDLLANDALRRLVTQTQTLPALPAIYSELLNQLQGSDSSMRQISGIVSGDLALCAKILQLVNSPYFELPERVADVGQAVLHLGVEPIKALVLSLQTFAAFERLRKDDASLKPLWNHSWAVGRLAQRIAQSEELNHYSAGQSFTAGLLHDVGKLIFLTGVPQQFAQALALQRESRLPLWRAEQQTFGCTHAEAGAYLLAIWGLPTSVVEAVAWHHQPSASSTQSVSTLTAVHAADVLERELEPSYRTAPTAEWDEPYLARIGLSDRIPNWRKLRADLTRDPA